MAVLGAIGPTQMILVALAAIIVVALVAMQVSKKKPKA